MINGPLSGVKIVELSTYVAAPSCARLLGDMGAEVIKVESFDGDPWRNRGKNFIKRGDIENPVFDIYNIGKESICINIKEPKGMECLMKMLEEKGIPTHFVEEISERETIVKKVSIVPLEVIVRNIAAGSLSKRLGLPEGTKLASTVLEYCYKDDALGDPFIKDYHVRALNLATTEELRTIDSYSLKINEILSDYLKDVNIELIDFKLEFGRLSDGTIVLADEISPDTCRFWDSKTHEKLDKDRFRRDLGGVEDAYQEVMRRLLGE